MTRLPVFIVSIAFGFFAQAATQPDLPCKIDNMEQQIQDALTTALTNAIVDGFKQKGIALKPGVMGFIVNDVSSTYTPNSRQYEVKGAAESAKGTLFKIQGGIFSTYDGFRANDVTYKAVLTYDSIDDEGNLVNPHCSMSPATGTHAGIETTNANSGVEVLKTDLPKFQVY